MKLKIGEIFDYNGVKLVVKKYKQKDGCMNCYFRDYYPCNIVEDCIKIYGSDLTKITRIIYKKATIIDRIKYFLKKNYGKRNIK